MKKPLTVCALTIRAYVSPSPTSPVDKWLNSELVIDATAAIRTIQAPMYSYREKTSLFLQVQCLCIIFVLSEELEQLCDEKLTIRTSSQRLAAVRKREAMLLASLNSRSFCLNLASYLQNKSTNIALHRTHNRQISKPKAMSSKML